MRLTEELRLRALRITWTCPPLAASCAAPIGLAARTGDPAIADASALRLESADRRHRYRLHDRAPPSGGVEAPLRVIRSGDPPARWRRGCETLTAHSRCSTRD